MMPPTLHNAPNVSACNHDFYDTPASNTLLVKPASCPRGCCLQWRLYRLHALINMHRDCDYLWVLVAKVWMNGTKVGNQLLSKVPSSGPDAGIVSQHLFPAEPMLGSPGVCNVKSSTYGAKGDYHTDDTAALQKALSDPGCATVFLPKGYYAVTKTLQLPTAGSVVGVSRIYSNIVSHASVSPLVSPENPAWPLVETAAGDHSSATFVGLSIIVMRFCVIGVARFWTALTGLYYTAWWLCDLQSRFRSCCFTRRQHCALNRFGGFFAGLAPRERHLCDSLAVQDRRVARVAHQPCRCFTRTGVLAWAWVDRVVHVLQQPSSSLPRVVFYTGQRPPRHFFIKPVWLVRALVHCGTIAHSTHRLIYALRLRCCSCRLAHQRGSTER